jgi:hypothetical protein
MFVATAVDRMVADATELRMLAAIALVAAHRLRIAANILAIAVRRLLEVVPYISPSPAAL